MVQIIDKMLYLIQALLELTIRASGPDDALRVLDNRGGLVSHSYEMIESSHVYSRSDFRGLHGEKLTNSTTSGFEGLGLYGGSPRAFVQILISNTVRTRRCRDMAGLATVEPEAKFLQLSELKVKLMQDERNGSPCLFWSLIILVRLLIVGEACDHCPVVQSCILKLQAKL